ncbi:hypothetical protein N7513_007069 [Penicillium frequentans]|nr:hypothetical protein N7513_007069 [Penicillium glabrum]
MEDIYGRGQPREVPSVRNADKDSWHLGSHSKTEFRQQGKLHNLIRWPGWKKGGQTNNQWQKQKFHTMNAFTEEEKNDGWRIRTAASEEN